MRSPSTSHGGPSQGLLLPYACMTSTFSLACLLSSCSRWPPPRPSPGQGGLPGLLNDLSPLSQTILVGIQAGGGGGCSWSPPRSTFLSRAYLSLNLPAHGGLLQGLLLPFTCMTSTSSLACLLSSCSRWPPPRPPPSQGGLPGLLKDLGPLSHLILVGIQSPTAAWGAIRPLSCRHRPPRRGST